MTENIIYNGISYDPYFVLGITKDDDDNMIKQALKKKILKYHPDKVKLSEQDTVMHKYNIIMRSYEYIKNKRGIVKSKSHESQNKSDKKFDNQLFEERFETSNSFGYGDHARLESIDSYDEFKPSFTNQFESSEFNNDTFNKLFEYNQSLHEIPDSNTIVHQTTDGFVGYNTANMGNASTVHSYNGLLLSGDDFGQSGVGYWDSNYSDYKAVFDNPKNPTGILDPSEFKRKSPPKTRTFEDYKSQYESFNSKIGVNKQEASAILLDKVKSDLVKQESISKDYILRYASQFPDDVVQQAMNGDLIKSDSLLDYIDSHQRFLN
jgi:curved DNA-binding protein CbpA